MNDKLIAGDLLLRPWLSSDAHSLALIANNKKIADNLRDAFPHPYSFQDAVRWLDMVIPQNIPAKFFAIEKEGRLTGSIGIVTKDDIYRKCCEIGYFIREDEWGKGIATQAIRIIAKYAFANFDIVRLYAEPFSDNAGSRKALEKAGFKHEATLRQNVIKNGIVKDSCIYGLLRQEADIL
ncbi:MAG TPA: GNAT family protein [Bacteroidales bacterium]|nr:GNAT family protein [Bacteroidales bacterium]